MRSTQEVQLDFALTRDKSSFRARTKPSEVIRAQARKANMQEIEWKRGINAPKSIVESKSVLGILDSELRAHVLITVKKPGKEGELTTLRYLGTMKRDQIPEDPVDNFMFWASIFTYPDGIWTGPVVDGQATFAQDADVIRELARYAKVPVPKEQAAFTFDDPQPEEFTFEPPPMHGKGIIGGGVVFKTIPQSGGLIGVYKEVSPETARRVAAA